MDLLSDNLWLASRVPNKRDAGSDKREHDEDHDDDGQALGVGPRHSSNRHHHRQIEPKSYRTEEEETNRVDRPYREASGDRREEAAKTGDALGQVQQMAQVWTLLIVSDHVLCEGWQHVSVYSMSQLRLEEGDEEEE
jgi:hypothetical protein